MEYHRIFAMPRKRLLRTGILMALAFATVGVLVAGLIASRAMELPMTADNAPALRQLSSVDAYIWEIEWSPDGRRVAFVRWEEPVEIRDAGTYALLQRVGEHRMIIHFAFSIDPELVAFCEDTNEVEIHNLRTKASIVLKALNYQPKMVFSPDGNLIATGGVWKGSKSVGSPEWPASLVVGHGANRGRPDSGLQPGRQAAGGGQPQCRDPPIRHHHRKNGPQLASKIDTRIGLQP